MYNHGSSTSAPPNPQRSVLMEHCKQEGDPGFTLGGTWGKLTEMICLRGISFKDLMEITKQEIQTLRREGSQNQGESSHNTGYTGEMEPTRTYSDSFRIAQSRKTQLSSGLTPLRI
ncbi:hypothetical protein O181_119948 [Austropuccinia psidii MF-1]|uniref:Uncharacterized protein n=1 Tax=Austropuccinia psidii MF-1 TaxID=1389203 RepID=A0A9Q3PZV5_9BASI|nr:hypothetical protein [Austropuccinia psidii MF-1]